MFPQLCPVILLVNQKNDHRLTLWTSSSFWQLTGATWFLQREFLSSVKTNNLMSVWIIWVMWKIMLFGPIKASSDQTRVITNLFGSFPSLVDLSDAEETHRFYLCGLTLKDWVSWPLVEFSTGSRLVKAHNVPFPCWRQWRKNYLLSGFNLQHLYSLFRRSMSFLLISVASPKETLLFGIGNMVWRPFLEKAYLDDNQRYTCFKKEKATPIILFVSELWSKN